LPYGVVGTVWKPQGRVLHTERRYAKLSRLSDRCDAQLRRLFCYVPGAELDDGTEDVLDSVSSPHSKRNYAKALDDLFAFSASRPLSRSLLMEWRAGTESLSPSTINVRLSAVCKLVGEARRNNMIGSEEAASLTDIPNISQKGTRLGNWLTREQAKELLAVPARTTLKGKRDYVILALLVGCALRRN
jgi:integrase